MGLLLSVATAGGGAAAEQTLSLAEALTLTLVRNPDVLLAAEDVNRSRGSTLAAGEPFDSSLVVRATASQRHEPIEETPPAAAASIREVDASATWARRFGNGLVVTPEIAASGTRFDFGPATGIGPPVELTRMSSRIRLAAPLLRDRGAAILGAPLRAARWNQAAAAASARQVRERSILIAASAYWNYLAAHGALQVLADSERRARKTVEETASLVKGDERTRADLTQAQGYLAFRAAGRIRAEQRLIEAAHELALALGSEAGVLSQLPRPVTDFPGPLADLAAPPLARWTERAIGRRADLEEASHRLGGAVELAGAAENALLPRLDLELTAGYAGQSRGFGAGRLAALHRDLPGVEGLLALSLELPIERHGTRGRLIEARAAERQARLARAEVERRVRLGLAAAYATVEQNQLALQEVERAADLFAQTVANEEKKFQLGSATLFSINQAEDSLTDALLQKLENRRAFAVSLARLRFESGTLAGDAPAAGPALAEQLTTLPQ